MHQPGAASEAHRFYNVTRRARLCKALGFRWSTHMKYVVHAFLIFSVLSLDTVTVDACTCSAASPRRAFRDAAVVFIGQVLDAGRPDNEFREKGYDSQIKFKIEESWKGSDRSEIIVFSDYWLGACPGFNFEPGEKYLVYAYREKDILITSSECAPSLPEAKASENIKNLRRLWYRFFARANPF